MVVVIVDNPVHLTGFTSRPYGPDSWCHRTVTACPAHRRRTAL